jgi:hypothetical protein
MVAPAIPEYVELSSDAGQRNASSLPLPSLGVYNPAWIFLCAALDYDLLFLYSQALGPPGRSVLVANVLRYLG